MVRCCCWKQRVKTTSMVGLVFLICIAVCQLFRDIVAGHSLIQFQFNAIVDHFVFVSPAVGNETTVMPNSVSVVFDVVSVGSYNRPEYHEAQQKTFGSHPSVRHFFRITEHDDVDQSCHQNLTNEMVYEVSTFCRSKKRWEGRRFVMRYLRNIFGRIQFLMKKANPVGWMCAQRRFVHGFAKAMRQYQTHDNNNKKDILPDYLAIIDDDTYLNMDLVSNFLNASNHLPLAIAGCMIRSPIHQINFTSPFGGWGMLYSKAALENMIRPIYCENKLLTRRDEFLNGSCNAINDDQIGEKNVFREGMSITDLMQAFVSWQPYSEVRNWTNGFCLHADWLWGYITNFYPISIHDPDPFYKDVPQARLLGYNGSEWYGGTNNLWKRKQCDYSKELCTQESHICHYQTPAMMYQNFAERPNSSLTERNLSYSE